MGPPGRNTTSEINRPYIQVMQSRPKGRITTCFVPSYLPLKVFSSKIEEFSLGSGGFEDDKIILLYYYYIIYIIYKDLRALLVSSI